MISMNDQRFFDLAMKAVARQSTDAERAELESLLASQPELRAEFERLRNEARIAKDVVPMVAALESSAGELPGYARERLQTKVRQTLGRPVAAEKKPGWRWWLVLAPAAALVVLFLIPVFTASNKPIVQVAMLDVAGTTRGSASNEVAVLQQNWKQSAVQSFDNVADLEAWEKVWPQDSKRSAAKIIYDRAAGEVRVSGRRAGKSFQKTFPIEKDLPTTLQEAKAFIREEIMK